MSEVKLEKIFKALANRRRLRILSYLKSRGCATVTDISEHLELSLKATSKHVVKLSNVQMIARIQRGTYMYYYIDSCTYSTVSNIFVNPYSLDKGEQRKVY